MFRWKSTRAYKSEYFRMQLSNMHEVNIQRNVIHAIRNTFAQRTPLSVRFYGQFSNIPSINSEPYPLQNLHTAPRTK